MSHCRKLLTLSLASMGAVALSSGCSSSKSSTPNPGSVTSCAKNDLRVVFSPMYSAFDGTHTFQIPAVVNGVASDAITWSASDKTMVDLAADATTGGVMITARKAGTVTIIASAGTLCGSSLLTVSAAIEADWEVGNARYNSGVVLPTRGAGAPRGGMGGTSGTTGAGGAASVEYACTNCHGDTATNGLYKTVSHTPEQTGGFSDEALQNIFRNGAFPGGATDPNFDAAIVSYQTWTGFHKWSMDDDQAKGIIVYLRSLTPQAQTGAANFGGQFDGGVTMRDGGGTGDGGGTRPDGGFGDGGGMRPDGGFGVGGRSGVGGGSGTGTGGVTGAGGESGAAGAPGTPTGVGGAGGAG